MVNLRQIMSRDFPISSLICGEGRNRLALQSSFLPNDQAVKVCQKQRMFLALVDSVCTAHLKARFFGEPLRHIILQITALPHGLVVDIFNGIADFIMVYLKCRAIRIQAKDGTSIRAGNTAFAVTELIFFGQIQCRYKPFHAMFSLSFSCSSAIEKSYSTKSLIIVEKRVHQGVVIIQPQGIQEIQNVPLHPKMVPENAHPSSFRYPA